MKQHDKKFFADLFAKLSQPMTCGAIDSKGVRYQIADGERSNERIFILGSELIKDKPDVLHRAFFNKDDSAWKEALSILVRSGRARLLPVPIVYCLQRDMVTSITVNLGFDLIHAGLESAYETSK